MSHDQSFVQEVPERPRFTRGCPDCGSHHFDMEQVFEPDGTVLDCLVCGWTHWFEPGELEGLTTFVWLKRRSTVDWDEILDRATD